MIIFFAKVKIIIKVFTVLGQRKEPLNLLKGRKNHEKYLKSRTTEIETEYKLYENLFESTKRRSKQDYYFEKLLRVKYNSKKHEL